MTSCTVKDEPWVYCLIDDKGVNLYKNLKGDVGVDLCTSHDLIIQPREFTKVCTNIKFKIPNGYYCRIADKSGLSQSLRVCGGVIDSSYEGEIKVIVQNMSTNVLTFAKGDRIAQVICERIKDPNELTRITLDEINELHSSSERGNKGFGSTGLKST